MRQLVRSVVTIIIIVILIGALLAQTLRLHNTQQDYTMREYNRTLYNTNNYYVTAQLYAVKTDQSMVLQDSNGKLWETEALSITPHDTLLLEIHNSSVLTNVWKNVLQPTN